MTSLTDALLDIAAHNPLRTTEPWLAFQVFEEHRETGTNIYLRIPTEHRYSTYREADDKADQLNEGDVLGFWFVADDAEEDQ